MSVLPDDEFDALYDKYWPQIVPADDDPPDEPAAKPTMRSKLLTVSDLGNLPPMRPLVDGLLYAGTLAQLSGPPGQYKSFWSIGVACSVATGLPFEAADTTQGKVVYVAAEGATGAQARILAWCEKAAVDPAELDGWLYVYPEPVQLGQPDAVNELAAMATDLGASLVVFDTRARCTLGLEENSATEQGTAISNAEHIIRKTGATTLIVHHSGRAGDHGRGSTAWDGAVWSDLRMTGEEQRAQVKCAKHKDVPDGCVHHYRLVPHTVSQELMPGCDQDARSTLVIVPNGLGTPLSLDSKAAGIVRRVLWDAAPAEGLTTVEIRNLVMEAGGSRTQAYQALKALVNDQFAINVSGTKTPRYVTRTPQPDPDLDNAE